MRVWRTQHDGLYVAASPIFVSVLVPGSSFPAFTQCHVAGEMRAAALPVALLLLKQQPCNPA